MTTLLTSTNRFPVGLSPAGEWEDYKEAGGYVLRCPVIVGDQASPAHAYNTVLLVRQSALDAAQYRYRHAVPVDASKQHRFGVRASTSNGTDQVKLSFNALGGSGVLSLVSKILTPPSKDVITPATGDCSFWLNQIGGTSPSFPAGSLAVLPVISHATAGIGYAIIYDAYLIPADQLPTIDYIATSFGRGTHEAAVDGEDLYVISHSFATVSRFSTGMVRQAIATTDAYPHDVIVAGGFVWVINYTGATLQRFDLTTLSNAVTYPLLGGFNGFGLAYDGSRYLYLGIGDAPNSRIIQFDTQTAVAETVVGQSILTTDVSAGEANLAIQYLNGSVWANHYANGQIKRISPSAGITEATINTALGGGLYGLGNGGTYIGASGNLGAVKIDPITNTVTATHRFTKGFSGSTNLKFDGNKMWGCTGGGPTVFFFDDAGLVETYTSPGGAKWAQPMLGSVYVGFYNSPYLNQYAL